MEDAIRPESTDEVTSAPGGAATRVYASELDGAHVLTDAVASYGAAPSGGLLSVKRDGAVVREVHIPSAGPHQIIFDPPLMGRTNEYLTVVLGGGGGVVVGKLAVGHYVKPARGSNRLLNPGFEMAGGGGADIWANWTENLGSGALADEGTLVHSGSHAAKLTAGAIQDTYMYQGWLVTESVTYQLALWTRGDGTNAGWFKLQKGDAPFTQIVMQSTGIVGTTYQQYTYPFTIPTGWSSVTLLVVGPSVNGGIAYFDDVSVERVG